MQSAAHPSEAGGGPLLSCPCVPPRARLSGSQKHGHVWSAPGQSGLVLMGMAVIMELVLPWLVWLRG